jgi:hypothetical protein
MMDSQPKGLQDEVDGLVEGALRSLQKPYGADIIEDVLVRIEQEPGLLIEYRRLVAGSGVKTVNRRIGHAVRVLTGYQAGRPGNRTIRTTLAKTYSKLYQTAH